MSPNSSESLKHLVKEDSCKTPREQKLIKSPRRSPTWLVPRILPKISLKFFNRKYYHKKSRKSYLRRKQRVQRFVESK
jgi:hypothetical protein